NYWGGSLEITSSGGSPFSEEEKSIGNHQEWDRASIGHIKHHSLDDTQQGWLLLDPSEKKKTKKKKKNDGFVDLGCVVCSRTALKWSVSLLAIAFLVIFLPVVVLKSVPEDRPPPPPPDNYTAALHKALLFFNAQKSGKLPADNGIPWRGDSGLTDGLNATDVEGGLVGGYYDSGESTKYHFPLSFAMTMLSWSVIEYEAKYRAIGEYDHVRDLIKWGVDYLLITFNSSATAIDKIHSQVGGAMNGSSIPSDYYCWEKPEDMDYTRPVQNTTSGPDLAGEMAAAMAAASIVFREDDPVFSEKLVAGAELVYAFARDPGRRAPYSMGNHYIEPYYNSTGYFDEYIWGAAWLFYATGNASYFSLATDQNTAVDSDVFSMIPRLSVLSWDNKLPAAMLILTRIRIFLSPGYPYEDMLRMYHNITGLNMCSYLQQYDVMNWTPGGLILLNSDGRQNLQYVANAAFLASVFADYLNATDVPGWNCGPTFTPSAVLKDFATSQVDYILGSNPMNTSYVVGYGSKYPSRVHHRGASVPADDATYSCTGGWSWRDAAAPNPNTIAGAMVGGPDRFDRFHDVRAEGVYTEPTIAGNAGLVAALVSLTSSGGDGVDRNAIFAAVPPLSPPSPPPPAPWEP
ncbi:endo-1,4-beta-glucanase, partial [Genlisea aurea]